MATEELRNEDDGGYELTVATEELRNEDDGGSEPSKELRNEDDRCSESAEELRNEDGHDSEPAEELRIEDDRASELTLATEETTTRDDRSFNDGSSNTDSEIDQRDVDASDSEHEDDNEAGPSSKQDSDECEGLHKLDNDPLYPGATITVKITMILMLAFVTRHKLTNEAISDLLYLLNIICPKSTKCCSSLNKFKKYFDYLVTPVTFCYYCPDCVVTVNFYICLLLIKFALCLPSILL